RQSIRGILGCHVRLPAKANTRTRDVERNAPVRTTLRVNAEGKGALKIDSSCQSAQTMVENEQWLEGPRQRWRGCVQFLCFAHGVWLGAHVFAGDREHRRELAQDGHA